MYFYCYDYVFLLYAYVWLPQLRFLRAFSSVVRQMLGYNPQRRGTAHTLPNFAVVVYIVCFVSFFVLSVCICVLYYCHRVATQLQLNISYIIYHTLYHISYRISYHIIHTYIHTDRQTDRQTDRHDKAHNCSQQSFSYSA